jgi:hypothetical protein
MNLNNEKEISEKNSINKEKATAGRKPTTLNKLAEMHDFIVQKRQWNVSINLLKKVLEANHGVITSESSLRKYCEKYVDTPTPTQAPKKLLVDDKMDVIQGQGDVCKDASKSKFEAKLLAEK